MQLIDFDTMFDVKLTRLMEENRQKYTEKQWEDMIPKLYQKFGDTYVAKIKCTPKEYYAKMTDSELVECLRAHLGADIPTPEFLCTEIEKRGESQTLLPLLRSQNLTEVAYALNLIGDNAQAYDTYFTILTENGADEEIRSDITDIFKAHADAWKTRALQAYTDGLAKEYMLEILSRVKTHDDEVFDVLLNAFLSGEQTPMRASYLSAYGDERALPYLLKKIEDRSIGFVEFQELKYAIEGLGGEYSEPRDFSGDKDYIAVEAESSRRRNTPPEEIN